LAKLFAQVLCYDGIGHAVFSTVGSRFKRFFVY
jgi:hypothetical protein